MLKNTLKYLRDHIFTVILIVLLVFTWIIVFFKNGQLSFMDSVAIATLCLGIVNAVLLFQTLMHSKKNDRIMSELELYSKVRENALFLLERFHQIASKLTGKFTCLEKNTYYPLFDDELKGADWFEYAMLEIRLFNELLNPDISYPYADYFLRKDKWDKKRFDRKNWKVDEIEEDIEDLKKYFNSYVFNEMINAFAINFIISDDISSENRKNKSVELFLDRHPEGLDIIRILEVTLRNIADSMDKYSNDESKEYYLKLAETIEATLSPLQKEFFIEIALYGNSSLKGLFEKMGIIL